MARDLRTQGFIRTAAFAPPLELGAPAANAENIVELAHAAREREASIVLFPELATTGFSCEDLFFTDALIEASDAALADIMLRTARDPLAVVVGAPLALADGRLLNCAFVLADGRVAGAVPKTHLPNYGEFYDRRWFASGAGIDLDVDHRLLGRFPLASDQLFVCGDVRFAVEVCEDLWAPQPPGARHALAGADLILNPSASNELVSKARYRSDLVRMVSAQWLCGYLYASSGPMESSRDLVFGGHLLAAENGRLMAESERFELDGSALVTDFDVAALRRDRRQHATFRDSPRPQAYPQRPAGKGVALSALQRSVNPHPFVPDDEHEFDARAREILAIQATGLARRLRATGGGMIIGLSGGLDSTLAFLVCLDTLALLGLDLDALHAITMPGPGTGERTLASARALAETTGVDLREVPIHAAVSQHLQDLGHDPDDHSVTFENAQARERTQLLFNFANKLGGMVVGTGDLSELALGWCTYNGDHMSGYNVNVSVPKTMISYLVRWYARHRADDALAAVLEEVLATPISPELVPGAEEAGVAQHTEAVLGPYELHDFFLFHYVRHGATPEKIRLLAARAFGDRFDAATLRDTLDTFLTRFHAQQFKRTALPPGPKVGTVSLSPRGDWRMPDESAAPK